MNKDTFSPRAVTYGHIRSAGSSESPSAGSAETPPDGGHTFSIGDLSREFGVTLRTLRFYEDRGLLAPHRDGTTRVYSSRDRTRLATILKGKRLGFTLGEISGMIAVEEGMPGDLRLSIGQVEEQIAHLERQKSEIETAIAELHSAREVLVARLAAE